MPNWFYTDALATQQGPVDDTTPFDLNRSCGVTARSLVWHEGMEAWALFSTVAAKVMEPGKEGALPEMGVCAHSGRVYRAGEMLPCGEALIGPEQKESLLQIMMEGAAVELAAACNSNADAFRAPLDRAGIPASVVETSGEGNLFCNIR